MRFRLHEYADVSTGYLMPADLPLLLNPAAPHHIANHDEFYGSYFYTVDMADGEEAFAAYAEECRDFGLSERFIKIMLELARQDIRYVRFDADGGDVQGLDPVPEFAGGTE